MESFFLHAEPLLRLGCFGGMLALMALWEMLAPCRPLRLSKSLRWVSNLGLVFLNTVLLRMMFPLAAVGWATIAEDRGWGLLNGLLNQGVLSRGLAVVIGMILLDLVIYGQHRLFHAVPFLWRIHRVHHADRDFDVTTGLRFHPLEILLSLGIKGLAIAVLGPPPVAVLGFEMVLNGSALFNHGNVSLPPTIDRRLRWVVVTPDMHRVHHSIVVAETNSNYGFNLPWWDYLFKTYCPQATGGNDHMAIGLAEYQNTLQVAQLPWLLGLPFMPKENPELGPSHSP